MSKRLPRPRPRPLEESGSSLTSDLEFQLPDPPDGAERLEQLVVDADLGRDRDGYTRREQTFRDRVDEEIADARERGQRVDFSDAD